LCASRLSKPIGFKEEIKFWHNGFDEDALKLRLQQFNKTYKEWEDAQNDNRLYELFKHLKRNPYMDRQRNENWSLPISDYDLDAYLQTWQNDKSCFSLL